MQSITIVHSLDHHEHEHTELCDAFLSIEKISAIEAKTSNVVFERLILIETAIFAYPHITKLLKAYPSRAPPKI